MMEVYSILAKVAEGRDRMKKSTASKSSSDQSPNKLLWSLVSVFIAAATIWGVISQARAFSLDSFLSYFLDASIPWILAAILCMLGFIVFEGMAIATICRAFGYRTNRRQGFIYSASDIYFSAITPSATGGQPMCAFFMIRDGIPGSVTTLVLIINLTMYTVSILFLGLITLILQPNIFLTFGLLSRILIAIGFLAQGLLTLLFLMLLVKRDLLRRICLRVLRFLCKIKLLRHEDEKRKKLEIYVEEYAMYSRMLREHREPMLKALVFNLLQRVSVISVPLCVFLASGGKIAQAARIWAVQCCTVIGSNTIPIPGAMGVSDYIMLDGFSEIVHLSNVVNFELLSRSLSFYVCVLLCGITTLIAHLRARKRKKST